MPDITTRQCDFCGALQKQTNHWYIVRHKDPDQFQVFPVETWERRFPEEQEARPQLPRTYACGQECLGKALSKWMEGRQ